MKITAKGHMAFIKLEDKNTGKPTGISLQPNVTLFKQYKYIPLDPIRKTNCFTVNSITSASKVSLLTFLKHQSTKYY